MLKRILFLVVMICICFLPACGTGGATEETTSDELRLSVTVNKTKVKVGDTVEVSATFTNLTGRDISIELTDWQTAKNIEVEEILRLIVHPESVLPVVSPISVSERSRKTIGKDAVFTQKIEYRIEESEDHQIDTEVCFYTGENYSEYITISCKPIMIEVRH